MSDIDFLVGEAVANVQDERIVFDAGAEGKPRLYADVGPCVCVDQTGKPLALDALVGRAVASVSTDEGVLTLAFSDGAMLRCDPSEDYEAWQVVGGKPEYFVVCLPGGEVAVWDERTPSIPVSELRESDPAAAAALEQMLDEFGMPRPTGFPPADPDQT
jgi:hypothetical protein